MATESHGHHIHGPSVKVMTLNLFALLILMVLTIAAAQVNFGNVVGNQAAGSFINNIIAMTIAIVKATLVVAIFMGVWYSSKLTKLWAAAGFIWFLTMFFVLCDYMTRSMEPVPTFSGAPESAYPREKPEFQAPAEVKGH
ncbi:MAG: hypothetical protein HONBIEJF_01263 [Fimbriimonadaceae bacterium]|nr:hypothetical protein [Fimbriimonadaceae bacterium]